MNSSSSVGGWLSIASIPSGDSLAIRDLLSSYLYDEVTDQERAQVEQALESWPELQDELESLRQTVSVLHALPSVPAPRPFTFPSRRRSWRGGPSWLP